MITRSWRHIWRHQLFTVNQIITMVMSKKDKILIKSLYEAQDTIEFL